MEDKSKTAIKAIDEMKANESLDIDSYHKCMVELAHNFFRDGDTDACIQTINKVDPEYFKSKVVDHMEQDTTYRDNVIYLAYKFIQTGMVDVGFDIETNQRMGIA
jgi:hypothetical protein